MYILHPTEHLTHGLQETVFLIWYGLLYLLMRSALSGFKEIRMTINSYSSLSCGDRSRIFLFTPRRRDRWTGSDLSSERGKRTREHQSNRHYKAPLKRATLVLFVSRDIPLILWRKMAHCWTPWVARNQTEAVCLLCFHR